MPIFQEPFGVTSEGVPVERYILINSAGMQVCILSYGGIIQKLEAIDRYGNVADVVLGFDSLQPYLTNTPYFGAIIGRYANRIANANFSLNGKKHQLKINNGPNHLHCGVFGFDKKIWQVSIDHISNANCLVLKHISIDGDEGYPGRLSVEIKYFWSDNNELRIEYRAKTTAPTFVNLTNHSYFNLANIDKNPSIVDHFIQINADKYLPVDDFLIPTGDQIDVRNTCMDFCTSSEIGAKIDLSNKQIQIANDGYDHSWILRSDDQAISLAAILYEPSSGRILNTYTTYPAIQFYTGNFLDGNISGKNKTQYCKYAGLCLETQFYPNSPNNNRFPTTVLLPDQVYFQTTIYQFQTDL